MPAASVDWRECLMFLGFCCSPFVAGWRLRRTTGAYFGLESRSNTLPSAGVRCTLRREDEGAGGAAVDGVPGV